MRRSIGLINENIRRYRKKGRELSTSPRIRGKGKKERAGKKKGGRLKERETLFILSKGE